MTAIQRTLQIIQSFLRRLFGFLGDIKVVDGTSFFLVSHSYRVHTGHSRLQSASNIVGVLVAASRSIDVAAIELLVENVFGVLLGLIGGI